MPTGNPTGRPTKCTEENIEIANNYLTDFNEVYYHQIPSMVGLAVVLKVGISTLYDWIEDDRNGFPDIASRLMDNQHFTLTNHGLDGTFNPSITKLLLTKHGYSDKQDTSLIVPDGISFNMNYGPPKGD